MSTTKANPEQAATDRRIAREAVVQKHAKKTYKFPNKRISRIAVHNVYGDAYRINFYAESDSVDGIFKTTSLVGSEFLKMKVETPKVVKRED